VQSRTNGEPREWPSEPESLDEIVGKSAAMCSARAAVRVAARSSQAILLTGRTGTGKDLVARAIHRLWRPRAPFVAHNCAVTPSELFDSAFFGHGKGAFTGADREQLGLLQAAHRGTFFLDELEAMDLRHQAKLLRFLDEGEVRPLGSVKTCRIEVRILAATNRDPLQMIEERTLRADLYYRLRGLEIHLPALAERKEDLVPLVGHFLGSDHPGLTDEAWELLYRHKWPGNVRELRNALVSAAERAGGRRIDATDLELLARSWSETVSELTPTPAPGPRPDSPNGSTLHDGEQAAIQAALARFRGNQTQAARSLGIDRSTLRRKLSRLKQAELDGEPQD